MFDLITGRAQHLPSHATVPIAISTAAQILVAGSLIAVPLLFMTAQLPEIPTMMAFVAAAPPPPPPPPPAPAPQRQAAVTPAKPVAPDATVIPIEAPPRIEAEAVVEDFGEEGVPGGVEGGVPGGVIGGVLGGLVSEIPPPPPPPPAPRGPVRIGGQIETPALLRRVEPEYPMMAVDAKLQGMVILEATVDEEGRVENVTLLRGASPLLDRAAIAALKQWRYSPLRLNGHDTPFVLTVTLSFRLVDTKSR